MLFHLENCHVMADLVVSMQCVALLNKT